MALFSNDTWRLVLRWWCLLPVLMILAPWLPIGDGAEKFSREIGDSCVKDNVTGTCQLYTKCATAALIDKTYKQFPEICSFKGKEPVVCCTDCYIYEDVNDVVITENGVYVATKGKNRAWDNCIRYAAKLPYVCKAYHLSSPVKRLHKEKKCHYIDIQRYPALIGHAAKRGEFPHMALLGYGLEQESAQWLCGGSIISDRYILTAGHCRTAPGDFGEVKYVALGILQRSDPPSQWQVYRVAAFTPHPQYRPPTKYHDIALIKTLTQITFGPAVLPICLVTEPVAAPEAVVVGWGAVGHKGPVADVLQTATLSKFNDSECSTLYPQHRTLTMGVNTTTQACYGHRETNHDTCEGDSGGPLQLASPLYGLKCVQQLLGVTSFGRPCGFVNSAGIYTIILPYLSWIEDIVWPIQ